MSKGSKCFGIDISKDVFDVHDYLGNHHQFSNDFKGFKKFFKLLDFDSRCVMEATRYYHVKLAYYLLDNNKLISVVKSIKDKAIHLNEFIQDKDR